MKSEKHSPEYLDNQSWYPEHPDSVIWKYFLEWVEFKSEVNLNEHRSWRPYYDMFHAGWASKGLAMERGDWPTPL